MHTDSFEIAFRKTIEDLEAGRILADDAMHVVAGLMRESKRLKHQDVVYSAAEDERIKPVECGSPLPYGKQ